MPRQRPAFRRKILAGALAATIGVAAVVVSLTFANDSAAAETSAATTRVSVSSADAQSDQDSNEPAISGDGRYVAFTTGEPFDPIDKINASQASTGETAPEQQPDADVYVRDTQFHTTTLISHGIRELEDGSDQVVPARGNSDQPSISANGRFVAFRTSALNIAAGGIYAVHLIVVCDRDPDGDGKLNATCKSTRISDPEYDASNPQISADGQRLSYDVAALDPPVDFGETNPEEIDPEPAGRDPYLGWVEVVNLRIGADGTLPVPPLDDRTFLTGESTITTQDGSFVLQSQADSTMAAGGTQIAFVATFTASEGESQVTAVYGYDISALRLSRLDRDAAGDPVTDGNHFFHQPTLSGDGRRYAFSDASTGQVLLYDRDPDGDGVFGTPAREVATLLPDGTEGTGGQPAFSADGRYLAFTTATRGMHNGTDDSQNKRSCLGAGGNQSYCDIVVRDLVVDHDRQAGSLPRLPAELASPSARCKAAPQPCEGTGDSGQPRTSEGPISQDGRASLSADGSIVAYGSAAADLIDNDADTNQRVDVFRHEFTPALVGDPVDFGEVPIDAEAVKDVPLTHVGFGPLVVTAVTVEGAGFAVFPGEACTSVVLHATEKCVVSVRFKPAVAAAATGTLKVSIGRVATPLTIALTGTGTALPVGTFAAGPDRLDFGKRPVLRKSPVKSITVRNPGTGPLTLGAVKLSAATAATFPADYQLTATACTGKTLPAGGSCRIDLRHRPTAVGVRAAFLTIAYTGPNAEALTFTASLTGEGSAPTLVPSPNVTPAGRVIQITGTDFPPGSTAKLSLTGMPGTTTATADANGKFKVPFVVLPSTWTGRRPLIAAVLPGTAPGLTAPLQAQLEFVIVPGSPQPPDFDTRK